MRSLIFLVLLGLHVGLAQHGNIKGRVVGKNDNQPLLGVNVTLQGTLLGTITNAEGEFHLSHLPTGSYGLALSMVGYHREIFPNIRVMEEDTVQLNIELTPAAINTEQIIVTASKRPQSLQDVPVSVSAVDASDIVFRNSISVEDALRYIPGVNITESQVNIRGSSGYSRGAGSRVLMLVDGIPFLTADTGELNFETIPIGQVERIEVVKGASSALYGSSALGGVINVLTKSISERPETHARVWGGVYGSPSYSRWEWGGGTRFQDGLSFTHSRVFGDMRVLLYGSRIADDGYRQNDFKRRYNGYVKMRYDFSSFDALTTTFNFFHQRRGSFLYWKSLGQALVPPDVQQGDMVESTRFFVASQYNHVSSTDFTYSCKAMWFRNRWNDTIDTSANNSRSDAVRAEFQGTWAPSASHIVTFGAEANLDRVRADLFGTRSGEGGAVFAQDEVSVSDRVKVTIGARFDIQDLDSLSANSQLNPKVGIVFAPGSGSTLRASFGRGFRSPSVAEAFVTTEISGFRIVPNSGLQPEKSYSYEVGINQTLGEQAVIDLALFRNDFSNLIESGFNEMGEGQFRNVTRARILGFESSAKVALFQRALLVDFDYTYVYPEDRTRDDILKYRPRHVLYASVGGQFGKFSCGLDFRYLDRVERIDQEFVTLGIVKDGDERVAIYTTDVRLGVNLVDVGMPLIATLNIKNIFQYNYVELIGNLAPPRTITLSLDARFD